MPGHLISNNLKLSVIKYYFAELETFEMKEIKQSTSLDEPIF